MRRCYGSCQASNRQAELAEHDGVMAEWLTLSAAASRLRWDLRKVESRARREGWQRRRGNRGRAMEYLVPDGALAEQAESRAEPDAVGDGVISADLAEMVAELRSALAEERVARARAEGELAAEMRRSAGLERELTARDALVAAERARGDRLEAALAEARRPWLAKVIEGLRRRGS